MLPGVAMYVSGSPCPGCTLTISIFPARGPSFTFRNKNSLVLGTSNSVKFSEREDQVIVFRVVQRKQTPAFHAKRLVKCREHLVQVVHRKNFSHSGVVIQ